VPQVGLLLLPLLNNFDPSMSSDSELNPEANAPANRNPQSGEPTAQEKFQQSVAAKKQAELDQDDDEINLWQGGYSPKAMVGTWIAMAVLSVLLLILSTQVDQITIAMGLGGVLLIWIVGGLRYAYRRLGYHYELTTQRFIHQSGLLHRQTDRIEVIDIDDVSFTQGPIQRMFGVGTISLTGSDRTHPNLAMLGIADVREVSGLIDDTRRKERKRRSLHIESI
jgi:membrane protein YdbS with pleckstrin-like domain